MPCFLYIGGNYPQVTNSIPVNKRTTPSSNPIEIHSQTNPNGPTDSATIPRNAQSTKSPSIPVQIRTTTSSNPNEIHSQKITSAWTKPLVMKQHTKSPPINPAVKPPAPVAMTRSSSVCYIEEMSRNPGPSSDWGLDCDQLAMLSSFSGIGRTSRPSSGWGLDEDQYAMLSCSRPDKVQDDEHTAPVAVAEHTAPVAVAEHTAPVAVADPTAPVWKLEKMCRNPGCHGSNGACAFNHTDLGACIADITQLPVGLCRYERPWEVVKVANRCMRTNCSFEHLWDYVRLRLEKQDAKAKSVEPPTVEHTAPVVEEVKKPKQPKPPRETVSKPPTVEHTAPVVEEVKKPKQPKPPRETVSKPPTVEHTAPVVEEVKKPKQPKPPREKVSKPPTVEHTAPVVEEAKKPKLPTPLYVAQEQLITECVEQISSKTLEVCNTNLKFVVNHRHTLVMKFSDDSVVCKVDGVLYEFSRAHFFGNRVFQDKLRERFEVLLPLAWMRITPGRVENTFCLGISKRKSEDKGH